MFEFQDEQNVAVQLPTGVVSHSKSDHLGRKVFDELQLGKGLMNRTFTYHKGEVTQAHLDNDKVVSSPETELVKTIEFADGRTIQYEYDAEERITKVIDSVDGTCEYTYDALGQLLTEVVNKVEVNEMTYDEYGNIKSKNGIAYGYNEDDVWKDKLISYNGKSITYDAQGNPTSYLGHTLTWEKGRQLKSYDTNAYKYNKDGIRISKTVNGVEHKYVLEGTNIVKETWGSNTLIPLYDLDGTVCGINYNGTAYYFYRNLQGDVVAITNDTGVTVAKYTYDAWGKCTITSDTSGANIATINPFRYRSYYYDTEIGLYYLQSRYYNPEIGRFINADDLLYLNPNDKTKGSNLYAYCLNDVVNKFDPNGAWVLSVGIEGQAAFVLGVYAGFAVNFDGNWNVCVTYTIGFAIITNISAYVQGYVAYYIGKKNVSQLKGWGVSSGVSFSVGAHLSGGGGIDIGFDRSIGGNLNVGYGVGASVINVPYFQTRIGYTGPIVTFNLLSVLKKWKNRAKKIYKILQLNVEVTKYRNYVTIYIKPLRKTVYIYDDASVKVR